MNWYTDNTEVRFEELKNCNNGPEFGAESSSRPNVLNLDLLIAHEIINNERRESFNYYLKKFNFVVSRC